MDFVQLGMSLDVMLEGKIRAKEHRSDGDKAIASKTASIKLIGKNTKT